MRFREDSFSKEPEQEEEERMPRNQVALFGLRLRRIPERLHAGRDERREATRKRLTSTYRVTWLMLLVPARGFYAGLSVINSSRGSDRGKALI
jgi:hypothetical protein